jgi:oligoribonuclease NrnB/cAMP/cGMP phosphodiesterase (DHH superfamily)
MLKVCFYHSVDLDGHCSGAIFKRVFSKMWEREGHQLKLIPYTYHSEIHMSEVQDADVYFIDCSPQPIEEILPALILATRSVTIIDHHKSLLENATFLDAVAHGRIKMYGRIGLGACALAWEYWASVLGTAMPTSVRWLAEYDAWVNQDKTTWDLMIMPFQYGMRLYQTDPRKSENDKFWLNLFDNALPVETILLEGKAVLKYEQNRLSRLAKSASFECMLGDYRVLAINSCSKSSMTLETLYDPAKHDVMCVYNQYPEEGRLITLISFYTTKEGIDCSAIAKTYGGGGHVGAAGCRVKSLNLVDGALVLERF